MSDRLIEVLVPESESARIRGIIWRSEELDWSWRQSADGTTVFKLVVAAEDSESVLEALEPVLEQIRGSRVLVLPVEAVIGDTGREAGRARKSSRERISHDELYNDLRGFAKVTHSFLVTAALSTVVAAIGFARDSATIVIAAMVIAPLLGPNMALALGVSTLNGRLVLDALRANIAGVGVATAVAWVGTALWSVDTAGLEVVSRAQVDSKDVVLALASGAAGALGAASVAASSLVGVMVAVALLPPLVAAVTFFASGDTASGARALLLLGTNVLCVNVAAAFTFRILGFRPKKPPEEPGAAR